MQEALTNVVRHASALHAWIDLERRGPEVMLTIRDEGKGRGMDRIRVLLVDDNRAFLDAAGHVLADDSMIEVVGMMLSPRKALDCVLMLRPDVVLLDYEMSEMSGLLATVRFKSMVDGIKVVIVSDHDEPIYRVLAESVHVDGFVYKRDFASMALPTTKDVFLSQMSSLQDSD